MKIYDFENLELNIELSQKPIAIVVVILSGDETVTILYKDGSREDFDAKDTRKGCSRFFSYYDGQYVVTGEKINKWLNWKPDKSDTAAFSYQRKRSFDEASK